MKKKFEKIEDYFPYVEHSLNTICKTVLFFADSYSKSMFSSVKVEGLEDLKEFKKENPGSGFIYVSRHRSHVDYFETQLAVAKEHMPTRIQGGDNLFIGPFDPFLRETGAFMAVRGEKGFYSQKWLLNLVYSALPKNIGPYRKQYEAYINKKLAKEIYQHYLAHILAASESSNDLLVYPEYMRQDNGSVKYGRSYSGKLLDFSPYMFILLRRIIPQLDKKFFYVAVNPSYERVMEDEFIKRIPELKEKHSKDWVYLKEFAYVATRALFPFFRPGKMVLKFGKPYEITKGGIVKPNAVSDVNRLKRDVGLLETPFPTQVIFHAMKNEPSVSLKSLEERVDEDIKKLDLLGVDTSHVKGKPFDGMLDEVLRIFDAPGRRFVKVKDGNLNVLDNAIISPYANHISHLI
jgi:1-acyl-sn-glycerol-3-phosphate acyltransferase